MKEKAGGHTGLRETHLEINFIRVRCLVTDPIVKPALFWSNQTGIFYTCFKILPLDLTLTFTFSSRPPVK